MTASALAQSPNSHAARWTAVLVGFAASLVAVFCARPHAASWNDGSRLATVEMLVDRHTLAIDNSVFVQVPPPPQPNPYEDNEFGVRQTGTLDKLFVNGHYYSDKSPVPAVLMAGFYQVWEWFTGHTARSDPNQFCRVMTLASSGLAYVLAVLGVFTLAGRWRLPLAWQIALTASFGLATVALPYCWYVNNHILLLAVMVWLGVEVAALSEEIRWPTVLRLGTLVGFAYAIDLGVGPVVLLCTGLLVLARCRRTSLVLGFVVAALPCLVLHHTLNYAVGGSWRPANSIAAHFQWPGSPFNAANMTGGLVPHGPGGVSLYALSMLFGKRGFFGHNLPLFLLLPAIASLRRRPQLAQWWALACCVGPWLLYAVTSNNSSGLCLTIRWFVPLLAPAYFLLARLLVDLPRFRADLLLLSGWGAIEVLLMSGGPWSATMVPGFWPLQAAALVSWLGMAWYRSRSHTAAVLVENSEKVLPWPERVQRAKVA